VLRWTFVAVIALTFVAGWGIACCAVAHWWTLVPAVMGFALFQETVNRGVLSARTARILLDRRGTPSAGFAMDRRRRTFADMLIRTEVRVVDGPEARRPPARGGP